MRCPYCQGTEDRVVDSRSSREGGAVRRRRECVSCGRRFTTYEYVEERQLQVVKRDGTIETFDRRKLLRAIRLACVKRGITNDEVETIVAEVEDELLKRGLDEVESGAIGELVMDRLKTRDHVAYVRFASVYRNFQDIDEFYEELRELSARKARAAESKGEAELLFYSVLGPPNAAKAAKCRFWTTWKSSAGASSGVFWQCCSALSSVLSLSRSSTSSKSSSIRSDRSLPVG